MRKALSTLLFAATLLMASASLAQNPNYDVGPVWRVTYFSIKPGEGDAFWKDFREHIKPLYEEYKKAGLIVEYKAFVNPVIDHPHDWDVAIGLLYPNYAALDQLDAKGASVVVKHYGSREAALEALKKRAELRDVVASHLAREVMVK
jgi:ABC-type sugar transport system substrate-binding protein